MGVSFSYETISCTTSYISEVTRVIVGEKEQS